MMRVMNAEYVMRVLTTDDENAFADL